MSLLVNSYKLGIWKCHPNTQHPIIYHELGQYKSMNSKIGTRPFRSWRSSFGNYAFFHQIRTARVLLRKPRPSGTAPGRWLRKYRRRIVHSRLLHFTKTAGENRDISHVTKALLFEMHIAFNTGRHDVNDRKGAVRFEETHKRKEKKK